jgi:hypothetical protein
VNHAIRCRATSFWVRLLTSVDAEAMLIPMYRQNLGLAMTRGSPLRSSASPPDGKTGKPVADITRYTYRDGDARYIVIFERQKTIVQTIFTDFDGAYHRFTGKVTIEKFEKDFRVEIFDDHAIRELMYLGRARSPTLWLSRSAHAASACRTRCAGAATARSSSRRARSCAMASWIASSRS